MKPHTRTHLGILAVLTLAGMGTPAGGQGQAEPPVDHQAPQQAQLRSYIFTYLVLDQPEKLSEEEMGEAMQGHFSNMSVMAESGNLLIAGPLAEPRIDPTYRGIFVFRTEHIEKGKALVATDPGVIAGVFKPEFYVISCDEPLGELTRLEKEYEQRRLDDPEIPDEWVGRMFMLAIGPTDAKFEHTQSILIDATMDRVDDDTHKPHQLLWIDATSVDEARAKLKADDPDVWSIYGWYGSPCVAQLNT